MPPPARRAHRFPHAPARAARPPFPTRPPPARPRPPFFHTPPARALPPVGACRIWPPLPPPRGAPIVSHTPPARKPRSGRFSTRPPPARRAHRFSHTSPTRAACPSFPTRPRPRCFSHTSPARAAAATVFPTRPPPAPCRRWGRAVSSSSSPSARRAHRFSHAPRLRYFSHTPPPARRAHRFPHVPARHFPTCASPRPAARVLTGRAAMAYNTDYI